MLEIFIRVGELMKIIKLSQEMKDVFFLIVGGDDQSTKI